MVALLRQPCLPGVFDSRLDQRELAHRRLHEVFSHMCSRGWGTVLERPGQWPCFLKQPWPHNVARVTHDFCGEQAGHPGGHPGLLTNRPVEALPGGLLCPHAAVQSPGRLEEDVPPAQVSPLQPLSPPCPLEFLDEAREFEQHVAKFLRDLVASSASEAVRLIPEFPAYIQAMSLSTAIDRMVAGLHSVKRGGLDCKDEVDVFSPQPPHHHETWLARNCSNSKCCPH